jgi:hypothetical protein
MWGVSVNNAMFLLIPALYGGIQALEFSAILARVSGIRMNRNMTGYAIQQSMYMATRLFLVFLLPILGFAVDSGMDRETFSSMAHYSLLSATLLGGLVIFLRKRIVKYYCGVIRQYEQSGRYLRSFVSPSLSPNDISELPLSIKPPRNILVYSTFIFTIYATGLFLSFYLAIVFPQFRTTISQSSGIFNAVGAVLLTFVVEPAVSRSIDLSSADAPQLVLSMMIGRWIAVALTGQAILMGFFLSI